MEELKPCPFCGGEATIERTHDDEIAGSWVTAACLACRSSSPFTQTKGDAISVWNRRTAPWVPVSERLPECGEGYGTDDEVLVKHKSIESVYTVSIPFLREFKNIFTHWMPMPEPPEVNHE